MRANSKERSPIDWNLPRTGLRDPVFNSVYGLKAVPFTCFPPGGTHTAPNRRDKE